MKRIMVIGCPGSGKSTFSRELHARTGIPLYHLDRMYWKEDRTTVEKAVFLEQLSRTAALDTWIIDGNYGSTMEMRMEACDTVVFLDYPTEVCLQGVQARRGKPRPDMPWVEAENETDEEFMNFIRNFSEESRPKIMMLLEKYSDKEIHVFKDRAEADAFLHRFGV